MAGEGLTADASGSVRRVTIPPPQDRSGSGPVAPPTGRVLCLGETMSLVTPAAAEPLETARQFRVESAGAESNVAFHLAALGREVTWLGRLGDDALGRRVATDLRRGGIDIGPIEFDPGAPTGLYVKDPGAGVLYYRAGSAASRMTPALLDRVDFGELALLHLSGITSALSDSCAATVDAAISRARAAGVTVTFDVNHRPALWPTGAAAAVILALAARADIVFVGLDEAQTLWGSDVLILDAVGVRRLLPAPGRLVVKDGAVGATEFDGTFGEDPVFVAALSVDVVEPVGAGDAFAAGYIAAWINGLPPADRLRAGHDRAALVLTSTSDRADAGTADDTDILPAPGGLGR